MEVGVGGGRVAGQVTRGMHEVRQRCGPGGERAGSQRAEGFATRKALTAWHLYYYATLHATTMRAAAHGSAVARLEHAADAEPHIRHQLVLLRVSSG